jgi:hypothetical protein
MRYNSNCQIFVPDALERDRFAIETTLVPACAGDDLYIDAVEHVSAYETELAELKSGQTIDDDPENLALDLEFERQIALGVMECMSEVIWEQLTREASRAANQSAEFLRMIENGVQAAENYANNSRQT